MIKDKKNNKETLYDEFVSVLSNASKKTRYRNNLELGEFLIINKEELETMLDLFQQAIKED